MSQEIKRIFLTGPPGSFWSGVDGVLRNAFIDTDHSDWTEKRQWILKDGRKVHRGAYFSIGNEFGNWICDFHRYSREEILETLDSVFVPQPDKEVLVRLHKSHEFSHHLDQIMEQFPEAAIVMVNNEPHKCLHNWHICEGFDHVYDPYPEHVFHGNYEHVWEEINYQHWAIRHFNRKHSLTTSTASKKWIIENFGNKVYPEILDGVEKIYDGVPTLHYPRNKRLGLIDTLAISTIPWKEKLNK